MILPAEANSFPPRLRAVAIALAAKLATVRCKFALERVCASCFQWLVSLSLKLLPYHCSDCG